MRHHPLLLGLGGFGGEVLRQLGSFGAPHRRLWIDQRAEVLFAGGCGCQGTHPGGGVIQAVALAGEEAREALLHNESWHEQFPWLPDGDALRFLSELGTRSTSGFRVLGRMSFMRSHRVLDAALRRAVRGEGEEPPPGEVYLIASAEGGTGGAILVDATLLLRRLLPRATFHALLRLPPSGSADRGRFEAGAYATLCEIAALYRGHPFCLALEGEVADLPRDPLAELWQRIFLFPAPDPPPSARAAREVAEVLALLLDPDLSRIRGAWPDARPDVAATRERPFSAAWGFHGGSPSLLAAPPLDARQGVATGAEPARSEDRDASPQGNPGGVREREPAGGVADCAAWEKDLDRLYEAFRSLHFAEQHHAHAQLWRIEQQILDRAAGLSEDRLNGKSHQSTVTLANHRDDLASLRGSVGAKTSPATHLSYRLPIRRNFDFEQRVNIARKLIEGLAAAGVCAGDGKASVPADRNAAGSSSGQSPPAPAAAAMDASEPSEARLDAWRAQPIFSTAARESSGRLRAVIIAPSRDESAPWAEAIEHRFGVEPEVCIRDGKPLRVWIEDLHHPLESIRDLPALRAQYDAEPHRALLHIDRKFAEAASPKP